MDQMDYAVVGGGLLGASIVLAVKKEFPNQSIVWFRGTHDETASKDINKIIRTPYPDDAYVRLAKEALASWESHPHFHKYGWIQVMSEGSYRRTRKTDDDTKMSVEEFKLVTGSKLGPDLGEGEELWLNRNIGCADVALALEKAAEEAKQLGVDVRQSNVSRLLVTEDGRCEGVEVEAGTAINLFTGTTIVSAGPWTPGLLEKSKVPFRPGFFTVAGVVAATMDLDDAEVEAMKNMPILVAENGEQKPRTISRHSSNLAGEVMMSELHRVLKVTTTRTFEVDHPDEIARHPFANDTGPNRVVLSKWLPQFANRPLKSWVCP